MRTDNDVRTGFEGPERLLLLGFVGLGLVLVAPVQAGHHAVRALHAQFPDGRFKKFPADDVHTHRVPALGMLAVHAVGGVDHAHAHAVQFKEQGRRDGQSGKMEAVAAQELDRAAHPRRAPVESMVVGKQERVESGFAQGEGQRIRRIELRIARVAALLPGQYGLKVADDGIALEEGPGQLELVAEIPDVPALQLGGGKLGVVHHDIPGEDKAHRAAEDLLRQDAEGKQQEQDHSKDAIQHEASLRWSAPYVQHKTIPPSSAGP